MPSCLPWGKFVWADWKSDPKLSACEPSTRGVWMDWLAEMAMEPAGELRRQSLDVLARRGRCSSQQAKEALIDLHNTGAADVIEHGDGAWTVRSRRLMREARKRDNAALRSRKHRRKKTQSPQRHAPDESTQTAPTQELQQSSEGRHALATPEVTPEITRESRGRVVPPTPAQGFADDLVSFLAHATGERVAAEDVQDLADEFGEPAVVAEIERRAEMGDSAFRRALQGPLVVMRAGIGARKQPAKPGAFKVFAVGEEAKRKREVERMEHRTLAAQAQPLVDLPREVRALVVDLYERTVKALVNGDNLKFGRGSVIGLLADESREGFAEEAATVARWMATDGQAQALLRDAKVPA